ncbi:TonB family protein [Mucilaginibacter sp. UYP25]|uniref:TonB family protein n=1 Tax=unclassified Mucilaginibacter TaxID=2617802 RepID=UPI003391699A
MSWLHYLIEANIYLGVFYLCYCLFLNRDTHYTLSRFYLIFSCVIAFVMPVMQLSVLKPIVPEILIEEPVYNVNLTAVNVQPIQIAEPVEHITFDEVLVYLYIAGAIVALFVLMFRLRKLYILTRKNQSLYQDQYKLVKLNDENTAFSFFNYLFIGSNVPQPETIIAHELVHIRQKHSADIIFLEVVKVFNWFNPFIYLIQRSLKTIHEYIADEQTAAHEQDALAYSSFLLNNAYGIQGNSIAHSFFNYNLLKKRIIMLNKNRSGKLARLKYLAAVPLCAGMLCASTLVFSKDYGLIELAPRKTIKLRLDSTKYALKITDLRDNLSIVSDKMVHENPKTGVKTTYTVNSLTETGKTDLMKAGMKIEIVERASAFADTNKVLMPPPPTAPVKKPFTAVYSYVNIHGKFPAEALKKHINGAVVLNFDINVPGKLSNVTVAESTHNGYDEFAVNALKKFPYVLKSKAGKYIVEIDFWLPGNQANYLAKNNVRKQPEFIGNIIIQQAPKMPPPPPAPPKQNRMPPPPAPPKVKDQVKLPLPARPKVKDQIKLPPPPPPIENKKLKGVKSPPAVSIVIDTPVVNRKSGAIKTKISTKFINGTVPTIEKSSQDYHLKISSYLSWTDRAYDSLSNYMLRAIIYPKKARENNTAGNVVVSYRVKSNHQIDNVKLVKSVGNGCDEQMIAALNTFKGYVETDPGEYLLSGNFNISDKAGSHVAGILEGKFADRENYAGMILIMGSRY